MINLNPLRFLMPFLSRWSSVDQLTGDIIVVTAITSNFIPLINHHYNKDPDIKFVAFVDKPQLSFKWQFLPICKKFSTPRMNAKIHKVLIHEFFPKAKYTIWIDGKIRVKTKSLRQLVEGMGDYDMMLFRHCSRNCLYSEAQECIARFPDNKDKIFDQICRYTQEGYPTGQGLAECPIIIRKNNKNTEAFNYMWWDEILKGSYRDQISFPYVVHKTGINVGYLPNTAHKNEFFEEIKKNAKKK